MVSLVGNGELSLTLHHALSYKYVNYLASVRDMYARFINGQIMLQCVFIFVYSVL